MRQIMKSTVVALITTLATSTGTRPAVADTPAAASGSDVTAMYVEVYVRGERRDQRVAGHLIEHDDVAITMQTAAGSQRLEWADLTPQSAFTLKARLIDTASAQDWLTLGQWGWERGVVPQARTAFARATKLDPRMGAKVAAITARPSGRLIGRPEVAEAEMRSPTTQPLDGPPKNAPRADYRNGRPIVRYDEPPTPQQVATSIEKSRKRKAEVERLLSVPLTEIETDHFLIFTDWDRSEFNFLRNECEGAYRVVARHFDRSPRDNVFVGKLPIYMFASQQMFRRYAAEVDDRPVAETVLGYFVAVDEMGHMAMWKPAVGSGAVNAGSSLADAQRRWGRTLIHEFAHAFIHRYRTNMWIPRWMNEGVAEVIAESVLPTNNYFQLARGAAQDGTDISGLFDDGNMPTGEAYPVMMTLVQYLAQNDNDRFLAMFNAIKDGMSPEEALIKTFGLTHDELIVAWRTYARKLR